MDSSERFIGKCYPVASGVMGWVPEKGKYQLFDTEQEYFDTIVRPELESDEDKE